MQAATGGARERVRGRSGPTSSRQRGATSGRTTGTPNPPGGVGRPGAGGSETTPTGSAGDRTGVPPRRDAEERGGAVKNPGPGARKMEGRRKEGRTDGLLARDVRRGTADEATGEDRTRPRGEGKGKRHRPEPPPPTTRNTLGVRSHRRAPTSARRRYPLNVFPEDDGAGRAPPADAPQPGRIHRRRDDEGRTTP